MMTRTRKCAQTAAPEDIQKERREQPTAMRHASPEAGKGKRHEKTKARRSNNPKQNTL